jgi:putative transposase
MSYNVRKIRLRKTRLLDEFSAESGTLYSDTVKFFWRTVRKKGLWLKPSSLMRIFNSDRLHAHSADASVQAFFHSLKSWRALRKTYPEASPPHRLRKFFQVVWKNSAIRVKKGDLVLSNGRGNEPLVLENWKHPLPVQCVLGWNGTGYELACVYDHESPGLHPEKNILSVDLGQIHLAATSQGMIFNGRLLRSLQQWRHKKLSDLQNRMSTKRKGSREWNRLKDCKGKFLRKVGNRVSDILHKYTTGIVSTCKREGMDTLVVGDLRGYRQDNDKGNERNQENHGWLYSRTTKMLEYKCERSGINFRLQEESYTSQTCPTCGNRKKMRGRNYACPKCGFVGHRDVVGAVNILGKYLGHAVPVVAAMRPAFGVRYKPYLNVAQGFAMPLRTCGALAPA